MKRKFCSILLALAAACSVPQKAVAAADDKKDAAPASGAETPAKKDKPEPAVRRDAEGNILLEIEPDAQKRAGIATEPIVATNLAPQAKAYGRVLDPAALAALANEIEMDRAAAKASGNELARLKTLAQSGNASDRAIQTAEAASLRDDLTLRAATDRLMLGYGKTLAARSGLGELCRSLATGEAALIKAELPAGESTDLTVKSADIFNLRGKTARAESLGVFPGVDPQTQGKAWLLLLPVNSLGLRPGEFVTAFLQLDGEAKDGFFIPESAVVRADGKPWVYLRQGGEYFRRSEISTDVPMAGGWFARVGFKAGEELITTGAQAAYSEEVKGASVPDAD